MIALIDADIVAFRCAASCETEQYEESAKEIAVLRTDKLMQEICFATGAEKHLSFLTGKGNFRKKINPEYKAQRKDKPIPKYLGDCKEYLITNWNSVLCEGFEADDALGMHQGQDTIICTIDKDLDMIPGDHYNWVKNESYFVSEVDGLRTFYKQLLIGDRSDNIFGVTGIGAVKAEKIIGPLDFEEDMYNTVKELYDDPKRLCMNMECLWIWR